MQPAHASAAPTAKPARTRLIRMARIAEPVAVEGSGQPMPLAPRAEHRNQNSAGRQQQNQQVYSRSCIQESVLPPIIRDSPRAADANRLAFRCMPMLRFSPDKAYSALRPIHCGLRDGVSVPFPVFPFIVFALSNHMVSERCFFERSGNPAIFQTQDPA